MGQTTRSQGISFTHEMWARIKARCEHLKLGRSRYFQMLVENDLHHVHEIYPHKSDGKWHFYPEDETLRTTGLRAAEGSEGDEAGLRGRRRRR
jgi:hypothetical protein